MKTIADTRERIRNLLRVPRTVAQLVALTGWSRKVVSHTLREMRCTVSQIMGPCGLPAKGYALP